MQFIQSWSQSKQFRKASPTEKSPRSLSNMKRKQAKTKAGQGPATHKTLSGHYSYDSAICVLNFTCSCYSESCWTNSDGKGLNLHFCSAYWPDHQIYKCTRHVFLKFRFSSSLGKQSENTLQPRRNTVFTAKTHQVHLNSLFSWLLVKSWAVLITVGCAFRWPKLR